MRFKIMNSGQSLWVDWFVCKQLNNPKMKGTIIFVDVEIRMKRHFHCNT